jgi:AhpD family alkylhydroperoxidase
MTAIVGPLKRAEAPKLEDYFKVWDERMGYLPNALMTMARKPSMVRALAALSEAVHNDCSLPPDVRGLIGQMASKVHGCQYCLAHTAANSERYGVTHAKIAAMWDFESSPLF